MQEIDGTGIMSYKHTTISSKKKVRPPDRFKSEEAMEEHMDNMGMEDPDASSEMLEQAGEGNPKSDKGTKLASTQADALEQVSRKKRIRR